MRNIAHMSIFGRSCYIVYVTLIMVVRCCIVCLYVANWGPAAC